MRSKIHPLVRLPLVALASLGLAACAGGGAAAPASAPAAVPSPAAVPDISGDWTGYLSVEGQGLDGALTVVQDGADLEVTFTAPAFGLSAQGTGTISATRDVVIMLAYNLQCPGEARMLGTLSADGSAMDGALEAGDCTGAISGAFSFNR